MRTALAAAALCLALPAAGPAQDRETVKATLLGKTVAIDYGRPSLSGRTLEGLLSQLPPHRMWRAGMNQVTTFVTDDDLFVGTKRVPAGKYTMYVHVPATGDWALVLNRDPGVPLKTIFPAAPPDRADLLWPRLEDYSAVAAQEVARVPLRRVSPREPQERFLVSLEPAVDGRSALTLTWGGESWTTDLRLARPGKP